MLDLWALCLSPRLKEERWLEHETAKAFQDPTGQGRMVVAVDTAVTKTQFLPLYSHVQSHTQSPETLTKGPRSSLDHEAGPGLEM